MSSILMVKNTSKYATYPSKSEKITKITIDLNINKDYNWKLQNMFQIQLYFIYSLMDICVCLQSLNLVFNYFKFKYQTEILQNSNMTNRKKTKQLLTMKS